LDKVVLEKIRKEFGKLVAVKGLDLEVREGEFMSLLGPSGCGKTTTLNMIMGYEKPTSGKVHLDGRLVNDLPVGRRDVGMVFQDYAIFLHMTVFQNLAFGLKVRKTPEDRIREEVKRMAEILDLTRILEEPAAGLNMSELQRVAIGRSMILKTTLLLLDEPLSNLDADLRANMRGELKKFQLELGQTMVYVTHDQVEAMSLSDRIAVMDFGELQQYDTPYMIYNRPVNLFVAGFIGSPQMNFFKGEIRSTGDRLLFENPSVNCDLSPFRAQLEGLPAAKEVTLGIRPEHVDLVAGGAEEGPGGMVCELEPLGSDVVTVLECGQEKVVAMTKPEAAYQLGHHSRVRFDPEKVHLFDNDSGLRIDLQAGNQR